MVRKTVKRKTDGHTRESKKPNLDVLILAAGEGTRMRPLTANIPKPLLPVAGKPFLEHTILALRDSGLKDIRILIGWKDHKIQEYFGDGTKFGVNISYLEQEKRLGTAHAVGMAKGKIRNDFLCINGDVVMNSMQIKQVTSFFMEKGENIMMTTKVDNPSIYGIVESDSSSRVRRIIEKPKNFIGNLANAGVYVFKPEIFDTIDKTQQSPRGEYEITDSLQILADMNRVYAYVAENCIDVTHPWDILTANEYLMKTVKTRIDGTLDKNVTIKGEVIIGKGTIVRSGTYIIGPVIVGEHSEIGPNCLIRPSTCIGNNCKVGNACEVKNTIIMDDTHVPHLNYVGDSVIGERCNLGAGTKVANLRFDDRPISATHGGRTLSTGRRKLGVIMGDDVQTGINSSIDAGTIIGENTLIGPGAFVRGTIAPNSRIF